MATAPAQKSSAVAERGLSGEYTHQTDCLNVKKCRVVKLSVQREQRAPAQTRPGGRVLFHTTYSEYFKQNVRIFNALDFRAGLTKAITAYPGLWPVCLPDE